MKDFKKALYYSSDQHYLNFAKNANNIINISKVSSIGDCLASIPTLMPSYLIINSLATSDDALKLARSIRSIYRFIYTIIIVPKDILTINIALETNADAFITDSISELELISCLNRIDLGFRYISKDIYLILNNNYKYEISVQSEVNKLSNSEKKILGFVAKELTNKQIADLNFLSPHTVKNHKRNICIKLRLPNMRALLKYAISIK